MTLSRVRAPAVFLAGFLFATAALGVKSAAGDETTYQKIEIFSKVLHYVQTTYVEPIDQRQLMYGAIKGMLATLDPHTVFMPPEEYREMKEDTSGRFGGIGLELDTSDTRLKVSGVLENTPAEKAGIVVGDSILSIDGEVIESDDLRGAVRRIKGDKGTTVVLEVLRDGWEKSKEYSLVRADITVRSVSWRLLDEGIGYVKINSFQERTSEDLEKSLEKLDKENKNPITGLVLDLRGNPGGLLDQAVRVADEFLDEGVIVTTAGRDPIRKEEELAHRNRGRHDKYPVVILMNGGSASASEIVAGALQDHKRAVVMGTQSFGKGSVQTVIELDDGSGLKLTIAKYYTPSGRSIQGLGITPDVNVPDRDPAATDAAVKGLREADLKGVLKNPNKRRNATWNCS
jgi:carboxyl-terminal processing protease